MNVKTLIAGSAAVLAAVLLALVTSAAPHAASGGLVAAYGFDEGAGTVVHDSIASANNGTAANTSWTTGRFGGALSFNGTSSWVTVPDASALDLTKGFTLEAWVKPAVGMGTNWETIVFKESLLGAVYALYANSDSGGPAGVANSGALDVRGPSALPAGVWTHVATTWDGSTVRLYVNGTQVATRDVGGTLSASIGVLHVGGNSLAGEFFKGQIDEVRIYNQAQAQSRITGDMTTSITPSAPPADVTPPTAPTGLTATNVATTSVTVNWTASTDNVGVAGYNLFSDGVAAGTATAPVTTFLNLSCGASHTFGVESFDAAGNVSPRTSVTVSTLSCPDTAAPSAPAAFAAGATTTSSIATSWAASSDNVGVAGYTLYKDGIAAGTATGTSFAFTGLLCGTTYTLGVEAFDAAGNVSARSTLVKSTVGLSGRHRAERADLVRAGHDRHDLDRDLVGRLDRQRRRRRLHALSQRRQRRDRHLAALHLCGAHLRYELHAGRRGVRRGGQRLDAHLDHRVDLCLPRRHTAVRAVRAGDGQRDAHLARPLVDGLDRQRRCRRLPDLP